jgi:hypothetical protein
MKIMRVDGNLFKTLVINGAANLRANYQIVDSLNVFPVPDGDTGTNMKMTIEGGVNEIASMDDTNIYEISKKLSRGMLMGARGNSGVILSQLFRGLSKGFENLVSVNAISLAEAFESSVKQAYKAVVTPVEGTILTVAREASEKMSLIANSRMSINEFFKEYLQEAKKSLENTPNLLPVLKEAGVVDSGGTGYVYVIEGMLKALEGEIITDANLDSASHYVQFDVKAEVENEFGYCTEFLVDLTKVDDPDNFDEKVILERIEPLGNSIVLLKDENIVKTHIHTLTPGVVLNIAQEYGEFIKIKVENMTLQHSELQEIKHVEEGSCACGEVHHKQPVKPEIRSKYSIVSVATGEGLVETFKNMGVDYVVSGGQSMNPSTEDFINGFDTLNADNIIVFPNNKNIILAANQAAKIYTESNIIVINSKTIAEGFSALTMLDISLEPDELVKEMDEAISQVLSCSVTYAVRDTEVDGIKIQKNDFIGILGGKIVAANRKRIDLMKAVFKQANLEEKDIVTIIWGKDVTEKEVNELTRNLKKNYSNLEVELIKGDQEVYSYILAIE